MCSAITRHLKPRVQVRDGEQQSAAERRTLRSYTQIRIHQKAHGPSIDGTPVNYIFFLGQESLTFTNYQLSIETHDLTLRTAGFRQVTWHPPELSTDIVDNTVPQYWSDFLECPPI
jgi:hypothetical protein